MTHPFDILPLEDGAKLIFTPCPGTKEVDLQNSLEHLAAAGATALITLMPSEEMQRNAVLSLPELCKQLEMEWFHLPIEDDHAPEQEFTDAWALVKTNIHTLLTEGKTIAVHCKGGTGRTGLVIAQILIERGVPVDQVFARVRAVRPKALQIPAHLDYLNNFARQFSTSRD